MSNKGIDFPQYRKLSNGKVYYKINGDRQFDEIQIVGNSANLFNIEAKQYPEMLRIQDLLSLSMEGFEMSTEEEYEAQLEQIS
jgi:hypothetical protein